MCKNVRTDFYVAERGMMQLFQQKSFVFAISRKVWLVPLRDLFQKQCFFWWFLFWKILQTFNLKFHNLQNVVYTCISHTKERSWNLYINKIILSTALTGQNIFSSLADARKFCWRFIFIFYYPMVNYLLQ